ncbi:MAG: hypothetical protein JO149_09715, partial [Gammaproteobacteria bacterium]|nr:hypothetical protein [Gammaproteobacteria bacterium]
KIIEGKEVDVLSPYAKERSVLKIIPRFFKNEAKKEKITHSALPLNDAQFEQRYQEHGYFELELCDLTKRFYSIRSTNKKGGIWPSKPTATLNDKNKDIYLLLCATFELADQLDKSYSQYVDNEKMLVSALKKFIHNDSLFSPEDLKNKMDAKAALAIYYHINGEEKLCNEWLHSIDKIWKIQDALSHIKNKFKHEMINFNAFTMDEEKIKIEKSISSYKK